jgi:hypothetical protein
MHRPLSPERRPILRSPAKPSRERANQSDTHGIINRCNFAGSALLCSPTQTVWFRWARSPNQSLSFGSFTRLLISLDFAHDFA